MNAPSQRRRAACAAAGFVATCCLCVLASTPAAAFEESWNDPVNQSHDWQYWAPGVNTGTRPGFTGRSADTAWSATGGVGDSGYISSPDLAVAPPLDEWQALWDQLWPAYQSPPDRVDPIDLTHQEVGISVSDLGTQMAGWMAQQGSSLRLFIGEYVGGPTPPEDRYVFYRHDADIAVGDNAWARTSFNVGGNGNWQVIDQNYGTDQDAFAQRPPGDLYAQPQQWGFAAGFPPVGIVPLPQGARLGFDSLTILIELLTGDADNDGTVTADDLIAVQQHYADVGPPFDGRLLGDADDEGTVTADDLIAVQQHFGDALGPGAIGSVPEPSSIVLICVAGPALVWRGVRGG